MHTKEEKLSAFGRLLDILDELRVKCPWDAKQTNESLRPNTIEEVYELADALISEDKDNIKKELGDVLLHVIFYAKIGSEKSDFDIADVCNSLSDKLIFRHPHVFGNDKADNVETVLQNWEEIKLKEKGDYINLVSGEEFVDIDKISIDKSLKKYKEEANFKRCLEQLQLEDVVTAILRAKTIMQRNERDGYPLTRL